MTSINDNPQVDIMFYNIHKRFWDCLFPGLFVVTISPKDEQDVLTRCLESNGNVASRVKALCNSVTDGRPLRKEIARHLTYEKVSPILELKKSQDRLTFFRDHDLPFFDTVIPEAIVFLTWFDKGHRNVLKQEIKRAQRLRNEYLTAKKNGTLKAREGEI